MQFRDLRELDLVTEYEPAAYLREPGVPSDSPTNKCTSVVYIVQSFTTGPSRRTDPHYL